MHLIFHNKYWKYFILRGIRTNHHFSDNKTNTWSVVGFFFLNFIEQKQGKKRVGWLMYDHFLFNLIHHEYVFYLSLCRTFMPYVFWMEFLLWKLFLLKALEHLKFPILSYVYEWMISINMVSNLQWIYPIEKITQLLLCEVFSRMNRRHGNITKNDVYWIRAIL